MHEDQDAATYAGWGMDYLKYDWCSYGSIAAERREDKYAALLPADKSSELKSLAMENAILQLRQRGRNPMTLPQSDAMKDIEARTANMTKEQIAARMKEIGARLGALHAEARKVDAGQGRRRLKWNWTGSRTSRCAPRWTR